MGLPDISVACGRPDLRHGPRIVSGWHAIHLNF